MGDSPPLTSNSGFELFRMEERPSGPPPLGRVRKSVQKIFVPWWDGFGVVKSVMTPRQNFTIAAIFLSPHQIILFLCRGIVGRATRVFEILRGHVYKFVAFRRRGTDCSAAVGASSG